MAGPTILLTPLRAPKFDLEGIKTRLRTALREEGSEMKVLMQKTTETWKHKPTFSKDVLYTQDQIGVNVTPDLTTLKGRVWMYLDGGTKIRWAVMSPDWKSKTRTGWLGSRKGRGRVLFAGRRYMQKHNVRPRPGIKARKWSEEVRKLRVPKFKARMKREFDIIARDTIK